jgi:hypothetical protein
VEVQDADAAGLARRIVDGLSALDRPLMVRERAGRRFVDR